MEKKKCKLSFKHWNEKITIELDNSEITAFEFMEMVEKLVFNIGFGREPIENFIIEWGEELKNKEV